LTTHDPQVAVALADHVVLLSETGQLLRTGTPREVMTERSLTAAYDTQVKTRVMGDRVFVIWDSPG
jgi:ABC-type cobalamin/Fe3+-siderophores transport system ATPase subunit